MIMTKILILTALLLGSVAFAQDQIPLQRPQGGPRGGGPRQSIFMMMDANKDGKVSKEEMLAWFDKVDTNKDGILSQEELRAARPVGGPPTNRGFRNQQRPQE